MGWAGLSWVGGTFQAAQTAGACHADSACSAVQQHALSCNSCRSLIRAVLFAVCVFVCSIYTSQSGWTIPDHMLRGAVKRVIKDDLLNTYQDFLRRWVDGVHICACACGTGVGQPAADKQPALFGHAAW